MGTLKTQIFTDYKFLASKAYKSEIGFLGFPNLAYQGSHIF